MVNRFEEDVLVSEPRIKHILSYKKELETLGKFKLKINEKENSVKIESEDAVSTWIGKDVITAINRGFNVKDAEKLFNHEFGYIQLHLRDFGGKNKKQQTRLKSRVIGRNGTCKRKIQDITNTKISVSGKTIGIIGEFEDAELARKTIEMLLSGARHSTAYHFLNGQVK